MNEIQKYIAANEPQIMEDLFSLIRIPSISALPEHHDDMLVLGGFFYTAGILFYVWKSRKYTHAIWHGFVLTGTIMHFFAVLYSCVLI